MTPEEWQKARPILKSAACRTLCSWSIKGAGFDFRSRPPDLHFSIHTLGYVLYSIRSRREDSPGLMLRAFHPSYSPYPLRTFLPA